MCDRSTTLTDPTADFVLSDLLTATEDLIDFSINVLDTIRLQSHFNDRNRRVNLGSQLQEASEGQKSDFGFVEVSQRTCTVSTTLKYDLSLYLDRILQACKRTKANLLLLRVSRTRSTNTTLLLVASTNVRVERLNKKVQLLTRLVKENGGDFSTKKKKKKKNQPDELTKEVKDEVAEPKTEKKQPQAEKKATLNLLPKEDLTDYVEIALSFRMLIAKYREFIRNVRDSSKSSLTSNGQTSVANAIILIPIAANAIDELNNILNRLMRIAFAVEAESNHLRQAPPNSMPSESKELYRQGAPKPTKDDASIDETISLNQLRSTERIAPSRSATPQKEPLLHQHSSGSTLKRNHLSLLKQNELRPNIRNQSAVSSASNVGGQAFKLTPDMIANIFEDFFVNTKDLLD